MTTVEINTTDIVSFLGKNRQQFTKADIKRFVKAKGIRHVNFMYAGGDGRLKTLNFIINSPEYLDEILTCGERVD
jgi:glutamine synthetase